MLGWLLAAYAVLGIVFVMAALLIGAPLVARMERLTSSAAGTMDAAAAAADGAASAFGGFDASLTQARDSSASAAELSREASVTLDGLASAMSISILGSQPLLPLAGQFSDSADQLRQLGDELDGIGSALGTNRTDVAQVGSRMRELADELATLQRGIAAEESGAGLPLSWLFYGFLAWQLLPIAAAGLLAARLLRLRAADLLPTA